MVGGDIKVISYVRGDMYKDGDADSNDAILLLRHVLLPNRFEIMQKGDLNSDRAVTTDDAVYLLRHTLAPNVYPLGCEGEHTFGSQKIYSAVSNGYTLPCTTCGLNILFKTQAPAFELTFEGDIVTESANDIGLVIYNAGSWSKNIVNYNGSKAVKLPESSPVYININDPTKLAALGTFEISFDYTTTKAMKAGETASVFSLLNNHYNGSQTSLGTIGWGWYVKYIEDNDVLATVTQGLTDSNSVSVPHNKTHKIRMLVNSASNAISVYVDGKYIGQSKMGEVINSLKANNSSFRFGDGPDGEHVFDNFTISAIK